MPEEGDIVALEGCIICYQGGSITPEGDSIFSERGIMHSAGGILGSITHSKKAVMLFKDGIRLFIKSPPPCLRPCFRWLKGKLKNAHLRYPVLSYSFYGDA